MRNGRVPINQIRKERQQKIFKQMKKLNIYDRVIEKDYKEVLNIVNHYSYFGNKKSNYNTQKEAIEDIKRVFFLCDNTKYEDLLFKMMFDKKSKLNYENVKFFSEYLAMKEYIAKKCY